MRCIYVDLGVFPTISSALRAGQFMNSLKSARENFLGGAGKFSGRVEKIFWAGRENFLGGVGKFSGRGGKIFWAGRENFLGGGGKIFWQANSDISKNQKKNIC